jgi:hypothetical protein
MPACSSHWEAHRDGYADEKPDIGRGVAADGVAIGDQDAGRSVVRDGATLPYRSRTATMTSLHAKGYGNALALPCWSGETGETGNYLGKVDRPMGVTAPV